MKKRRTRGIYRTPSGDSCSSLSVKLFKKSNSSQRALSSKRYASSLTPAGYDDCNITQWRLVSLHQKNSCYIKCLAYLQLWVLRDVLQIDALDHWRLQKLLGIKCYHHVWNDDERETTKQLYILAIVEARRFSLFGHMAWMPDETHAQKILTASPLENWSRPQGCPYNTWM